MADVLTLGQQQIKSSALSGPIEISVTFKQQHVPNGTIVGSPQVSFLMCTLEIPQNNAVQVLCS